MSNPKCGTCKHYNALPIRQTEGECTDPSKIIYVHGRPINDLPTTFEWADCYNHKQEES